MSTKTRTKLIWIALTLIVLLLSFKTDTFSILISGDPEALKEVSRGNIAMLLLITLVLMIIQNTFPVLPLLLLISMNVSIFGLNEGYIWSWFISIIGAIIAFMITRYGFQALFHKYVSEKIKLRIEAHGFWYVILGRLLPFMPSSLVNIAAGGSSVRFNNFLLATIIGNTVYYSILYLISQGLLSIHWKGWF
ncbi:MAG: VTT domain-containing protein [Paenibacillaceae bacterium]